LGWFIVQAALTGTNVVLSGSVDASFAEDWKERDTISQTGCIISLCGAPISFFSRRQKTVPCSTTDTELQALSAGVKEILWLREMLKELGFPQEAVIVSEDNAAAVCLTSNVATNNATKHLVIRHEWLRAQLAAGVFTPVLTPSAEQTSDVMTKALPRVSFERHRDSTMG